MRLAHGRRLLEKGLRRDGEELRQMLRAIRVDQRFLAAFDGIAQGVVLPLEGFMP